MLAKVKAKKKAKPKIFSSHLHLELIDDLVGKIASEAEVKEKLRWSWGLMKECEILVSSEAAKKHIAKCKSCRDFLNSRRLLAELVILGGRAHT
ncbi:MAG: hypothetical protein WAV28_14825 [Sedimentisphaerales bacterium]